MQSRDFCFWLQGFFELNQSDNRQNQSSPNLTSQQVEMIRNHLNLVFKHEIDPSMGSKDHQDKLDFIHSNGDPDKINAGPHFHNQDIKMRC